MSYLASFLFGYRVEILQGVQIATAALAYGIIFLALERMLGRGSALRTSILLIVLLPFISHGVLPTNMHTALWGYSGALFALTMQPSLRRDLVLALSCTVALLGYVAGVVASFRSSSATCSSGDRPGLCDASRPLPDSRRALS